MDLKNTFPSILENFTFSLILFGLMYDTSLQHANIESMFFFFFLFSIRYLSTTWLTSNPCFSLSLILFLVLIVLIADCY